MNYVDKSESNQLKLILRYVECQGNVGFLKIKKTKKHTQNVNSTIKSKLHLRTFAKNLNGNYPKNT